MPFSIIPSNASSSKLANSLQVPVISGVEKVLKTTIMSYFNQHNIPGIAFEAGQHNDPNSATIMEAAVWASMAHYGMIDSACGPSQKSGDILSSASNKSMPKKLEFLYRHDVTTNSKFRMVPGFQNFMPVKKGQYLADDIQGMVLSPYDGMILMPLYQQQGEDGFFIVEGNTNPIFISSPNIPITIPPL